MKYKPTDYDDLWEKYFAYDSRDPSSEARYVEKHDESRGWFNTLLYKVVYSEICKYIHRESKDLAGVRRRYSKEKATAEEHVIRLRKATTRIDDVASMRLMAEKILSDPSSPINKKQREILYLRYGFDGGGTRTLEEVAKMRGVSREAIRSMEARAFEKIRKYYADSSR